MSELTEKIEKLERENASLRELDTTTLQKVNGLRATIKMLKDEFPDRDIEILLPQLVDVVF